MEPYFEYELTAVPTALFKDATSMRKTDKSQLAKELLRVQSPPHRVQSTLTL